MYQKSKSPTNYLLVVILFLLIRSVELLGRQVTLPYKNDVIDWPSKLVSNSDSDESRNRVKIQTVRRPPTRRQIESWIKVKKVMNRDEIVKPPPPILEQSQHVKLRVRNNSEDSLGSEMTCSLPSVCSEDTDQDDDDCKNVPVVKVLQVENDKNSDNHISQNSDCDIFKASPRTTPTPINDSLVLLPSPVNQTENVDKSKPVKRRRISWEDQTVNIEDRLAKSPGFKAKFATPEMKKIGKSQIEATSPQTPKPLIDLMKVKVSHSSHLTMLCLELCVQTRYHLLPDPQLDPIVACFYRLMSADEDWEAVTGCIVVGDRQMLERTDKFKQCFVPTELQLVRSIVRLVRDTDPDILSGYEVQMSSWGYLSSRAASLSINLCPLLSRVPASIRESKIADLEDNPGAQYDAGHTSEIHLVGRNVFNIWRLMRSELALYSYTLENVVKTVLGQRRPRYSHATLTSWWTGSVKTRARVVEYYIGQLHSYTEVMTRLDLLSRSSELARLFGIQLSEVFSRGSQYRVESSMLRLAKPRNYVPVSPSRQQLASQAAPEYLALLLEPESKMYNDPVLVLDFQSLYPSIMIAHNYCFTTCLGRVQHLGQTGPYQFGCTQLKISPERLEALKDHITISPGGIVFLKSTVRQGILPRMLQDILQTRIMVKQSMKKHKNDPHVQKILHSRQLGLKLIANVTYGYTSANFSGRMPCIEVGDSVVAKGREALEIAIRTIEDNDKWGAKVVYGDTDSVFVLLKGKSKDEAFDIGEEMARVVTEMNPKPMKLKFEKVYLPCILQTKKRYVGYMYETRDQVKPVYDAKGIETVRRDGIPATVKMLEKTIRILFETKNLSEVKQYVLNQFRKLQSGSVNIQDLTFAKEFRGLRGYRPTACVPALELTKAAIRVDRRAVPRVGERVPYVVVYGEPGLPLIQLVRPPDILVTQPHLRPNCVYYITKVIIPCLNRCLLLVGADAMEWFNQLPKSTKTKALEDKNEDKGKRQIISQYFSSKKCAACGDVCVKTVCDHCTEDKSRAITLISSQISKLERQNESALTVCIICDGSQARSCVSLDCPAMYRKRGLEHKRRHIQILQTLSNSFS